MMSILALAGFGFGDPFTSDDGDIADHAQDDLSLEQDEWAGTDPSVDLTDPQTLDFDRGDTVQGFDPATDVLELEYSRALGVPEVSLTTSPDGLGTSVALNGVVVANVANAQSIDPASVVLVAV